MRYGDDENLDLMLLSLREQVVYIFLTPQTLFIWEILNTRHGWVGERPLIHIEACTIVMRIDPHRGKDLTGLSGNGLTSS